MEVSGATAFEANVATNLFPGNQAEIQIVNKSRKKVCTEQSEITTCL